MAKDGEEDRSSHQLRPSLTDELQDLFAGQPRRPDPRNASFEVVEFEMPGTTGPHAVQGSAAAPGQQFGDAIQITSLIISESGERTRQEFDSSVLMIGRAESNSIVLADASVSQHHARVVLEGGDRLVIFDLESTNGVYVNGRRIKERRWELAVGDEIGIGDHLLRFIAGVAPPHWGDKQPPPPPPPRRPSASGPHVPPEAPVAQQQLPHPAPVAQQQPAHPASASSAPLASEEPPMPRGSVSEHGLAADASRASMHPGVEDPRRARRVPGVDEDDATTDVFDQMSGMLDVGARSLDRAEEPVGGRVLHESETRFVSASPTLATALDQLVHRQEAFERHVRDQLERLERRVIALERRTGSADPAD